MAAPPPLGSTAAPPPLGSTAAPLPLSSTTAAPPPLSSTTAAPPPLSSTTALPPLGSNTAAPPPLSSTTTLHPRALALTLGRKPTKFEVFKVMHWDKRNKKWVDQRSKRVALEVETRIADDPNLSDESPLDESRLEKIDEHYVECAGTTQQSIYGVGNYGSLMSSHQREIERARVQGRVQGRAEIQNKLDEVLA